MADEKYIKLSDAKDEFYYTLADKDCAITDYKQAYEILDGVEAADVRPVVRGQWIYDGFDEYHCSNCGAIWTVSEGSIKDWHGCPSCLADMRERQN